MTLLQLKYLCEIVERGMSISAAAVALHTSQPSISRQMQAFERELDVNIFVRNKRRILGLTAVGEEVRELASRVLTTTDRLRRIRKDFSRSNSGTLTITTLPTHARYVLPTIIQEFNRRYPKVRIVLRQGNPTEVAHLIGSGNADLSICSKPLREVPGVALIACHDHHKIVLTPRGHPLLKKQRLTIRALSNYPLITYDAEFSTYSQVMRAFQIADREPNIILNASDVDVMKEYVKRGLGVAIVVACAYDPDLDADLGVIDAKHLFPPNKIFMGIPRHAQLRGYALDFIKLFAPQITREAIAQAISVD